MPSSIACSCRSHWTSHVRGLQTDRLADGRWSSPGHRLPRVPDAFLQGWGWQRLILQMCCCWGAVSPEEGATGRNEQSMWFLSKQGRGWGLFSETLQSQGSWESLTSMAVEKQMDSGPCIIICPGSVSPGSVEMKTGTRSQNAPGGRFLLLFRIWQVRLSPSTACVSLWK